ncbi:MAG: T9SS type A sorting domain-containing protein [Fibrobacter sp.]|nr:T9SS type A sorting domain-containing protein [Fibrobacter sp.]
MKKIFMGILLLAITGAWAVNHPFPQNSNYDGRGIIATNASATTIKSKFDSWLGNHYVEEGNEARIKFDQPDYTVSEGIAYAMIAMVYLSDNSKSYQSQFDKLWNYYKNRRNANGLMNWKIQGFNTSCNGNDCNGATDGDLDVAFALAMGSYQFKNNKSYMADAKDLIGRIRTHEIESNSPHILKPGDMWNAKYNPSYFSPAHMDLFKSIDNAGASRWTAALADNYTMMKANQHGTTGLHSDWCNKDGSVNGPDEFGYEGIRIPWRVSMGYLWYGHSDAKLMMDKMANWIKSKYPNPSNIGSEFNRSSGNAMHNYSTGGFTGAFASTMLTNSANQSYLNSAYTALMSINASNAYYHGGLQILNALLITGNMPNLATNTPGSGTGNTGPGQATGSDIIDDLEDGDHITKWGGEWYTYNDHEDGANSTVSPLTAKTPQKILFSPTAGGAPGSTGYSAKITYSLDQGTFEHDPFVGLGMNLRADEKYHDLSSCTEIQYKYKGSAHRFRVESNSVEDFNYHGLEQSDATSWTTVSLGWNDLFQENWGPTAPTADINSSGVKAFSWQVQGETGLSGDLAIDDVVCIGGKGDASGSSGTTPGGNTSSSSSSPGGNTDPGGNTSSSSSSPGGNTNPGGNTTPGGSDKEGYVSGFNIWGVYVDKLGSTVSPDEGESPVVVENGKNVAKADMTVLAEPKWEEGVDLDYPFVGMMMQFKKTGTENLSAVKTIKITYKSSGNIRMALEQTGLTDGNEYGIDLVPQASYGEVIIAITDLEQPSWATVKAINMAATKQVKWELKESTGGTGSISIQSLEFVGYNPESGGGTTPGGNTTPGGTTTPGTTKEGYVGDFNIWGVYVDKIGSTVSPDAGESPVVIEGGINVAKADMTVLAEPTWVEGADLEYPFVGMMMQLKTTGTENLSAVTAIKLTYKSSGNIRMALEQTGLGDGAEYGIDLTPQATLTTVTIPISTLAQPDWVSGTQVKAINMAATKQVKWELKESTGGTGSITISGIEFVGYTPSTGSGNNTPVLENNVVQNMSIKAVASGLSLQSTRSGMVKVSVHNIYGQVLFNQNNHLEAGVNYIALPQLKQGVYVVRVSSYGQHASRIISIK